MPILPALVVAPGPAHRGSLELFNNALQAISLRGVVNCMGETTHRNRKRPVHRQGVFHSALYKTNDIRSPAMQPLLVTESNPTLGQIIRTHSHCDLVSKNHTDAIPPEFSSQVGLNFIAMLRFHEECTAWVHLLDGAFHIDEIVCGHCHLR